MKAMDRAAASEGDNGTAPAGDPVGAETTGDVGDAGLKARFQQQLAKLARYRTEISQRDRAIERARSEHLGTQQRIEQLSVDVARLTAMLGERDRQIQALHGTPGTNGVSRRMIEDAQRHIGTLHRLRAQLARAEAQIRQLSAEGAQLTCQVDRLQRAQNRFRATLDEAAEAILLIDDETGLFVDVNETACRWLHRTRNELLALRAGDVDLEFPIDVPDDAADHVPNTRRSSRAQVVRTGAVRRRDGTTFTVEVSVARRRFESREVILIVAREINERRRTEEALKQVTHHYRSLFHLSHDAIYLSARDGTVAEANTAAAKLFGYSANELKGLEARKLYVRPEDIRAFQQAVEEDGCARDMEMEFQSKNGKTFRGNLSATLRRSADGNVLGYQCIVRALDTFGQDGT